MCTSARPIGHVSAGFERQRHHALSAMILRASGIAIAEYIAAATFSPPRVLLSGEICIGSSGRSDSSWLQGLTDKARLLYMISHLTQETRVCNVEDDVAGIICQALCSPRHVIPLNSKNEGL